MCLGDLGVSWMSAVVNRLGGNQRLRSDGRLLGRTRVVATTLTSLFQPLFWAPRRSLACSRWTLRTAAPQLTYIPTPDEPTETHVFPLAYIFRTFSDEHVVQSLRILPVPNALVFHLFIPSLYICAATAWTGG